MKAFSCVARRSGWDEALEVSLGASTKELISRVVWQAAIGDQMIRVSTAVTHANALDRMYEVLIMQCGVTLAQKGADAGQR
ncbi:hypothetical protein IAE35_06715 [Pseudomonas sp. S75]|uniref:hypothetical protein n=1 Tax=unclassified Pseudomonas TaxID=196821 RepID=UPI0019056E34|nr:MULTISPECIES: hypothetical protein [unclassified Pseudomonas]MBJ9975191.1 hypothetical protein [Pseudomonas sp. S30]MBK0153028.1 hypothetical protein [Pseudomonas sp. S75]